MRWTTFIPNFLIRSAGLSFSRSFNILSRRIWLYGLTSSLALCFNIEAITARGPCLQGSSSID